MATIFVYLYLEVLFLYRLVQFLFLIPTATHDAKQHKKQVDKIKI